MSVASIPPVITPAGDGYMDFIMQEMFARADLDMEYQFVDTPAWRGLMDAADGIIHGVSIPHADMSGNYPTLVPMPEPVFPLEFASIFLRGDVSITKPEDFKNYSVAHIHGWKQADELFAGHDHVEQVRNPFILMKMLALGRADVVFFSTSGAQYIGKEIGLEGLNLTDFRVERHPYLHFNVAHRDLIDRLQPHLRAMKADGAYDDFLTGYKWGR